jgi:hypothetical protein
MQHESQTQESPEFENSRILVTSGIRGYSNQVTDLSGGVCAPARQSQHWTWFVEGVNAVEFSSQFKVTDFEPN